MIRLVVAAGGARPGPPLSPVLGQHQIKVAEFITEFNRGAERYTPGVPLGVRVTRVGPKWTLRVCPPTWTLLFRSVQHAGAVTPVDLYGALRFRNGRVDPPALKTVLGSLRSCRLTVR